MFLHGILEILHNFSNLDIVFRFWKSPGCQVRCWTPRKSCFSLRHKLKIGGKYYQIFISHEAKKPNRSFSIKFMEDLLMHRSHDKFGALQEFYQNFQRYHLLGLHGSCGILFFLKSWSLAQASTRKAAVSSFKSPGCWVLVLHAAVRPKFAGELARMLLSEAVSSAQTSGGGSGGGERAVFARFSQRQFFVVVVSPPPHCGLGCLK